MTEEMKAKRKALQLLSKEVASYVDEGEAATINDALALHYAKQGHSEIRSFNQWLTKGMRVKKGEKALLLWGEPRRGGKIEQEKTANPNDDGENKYKFFPLAYVFSSLQVEEIQKKKAA